jgi:TPP-dependent pyruvate/acetoin dehydrogenase alpha subunit
VARARRGDGPTLLECKTYRMKGHAEHDAQGYVSKEELAAWQEKDPIARLERDLETAGLLSEPGRQAVRDGILSGLEADLASAEASPMPDPAEALRGVFAEGR